MQTAQHLDPSAGIRAYMAYVGQVPNRTEEERKYVIQVTRKPEKSAKFERILSTGNTAQAEMVWAGLNIGNGFRARMLLNDKVIARKS